MVESNPNFTAPAINKAVFDRLRDLVLILSELDTTKPELSERTAWALSEMRDFLGIHGMAPVRQYFTAPRSCTDDSISMEETLRVCYKVIGNGIFPQARNAKIFLEDIVRSLPTTMTINEIVDSCQGLWKERHILRACRKSFLLEEVARATGLHLCGVDGMNAAHTAGYTGGEIVRAGFVTQCSFGAMMRNRRAGHYSLALLCWGYALGNIGVILKRT